MRWFRPTVGQKVKAMKAAHSGKRFMAGHVELNQQHGAYVAGPAPHAFDNPHCSIGYPPAYLSEDHPHTSSNTMFGAPCASLWPVRGHGDVLPAP